MRRYRKGQTFRPPTAAESAASADAVEAFRRQAQQPQARPRGSDIVKTPANGIPGRDGATIYSAACLRCVESYEAEEKTLMETDEELEVFNLDSATVPGSIYLRVGLTLGGTLCVEQGGHPVRFFELKTSLTAGGSATAYLRERTAPNTFTTDTGTTFTVYDDIGDREGTGRDDAGSGGVGAYGKAIQFEGDWYIFDLECP